MTEKSANEPPAAFLKLSHLSVNLKTTLTQLNDFKFDKKKEERKLSTVDW